jgi:type I restriction enzyme R subunit
MARRSKRREFRSSDPAGLRACISADASRRIDTAYEVYLGFYQAIIRLEERQKLFREFSAPFLSPSRDRLMASRQRGRGCCVAGSLEYFSSATQIGMIQCTKLH